jgi:hypothetical protein
VGWLPGNRNIYRRKIDDNLVDTAVTLLVDMSGSMSDTKAMEAMKAAYVFAESLDKVGVPIEVLGFHSDRIEVYDPHKIYCRLGKIEMPVFKSFEENMKVCMWKVGLIAGCINRASGCDNADGDSLIPCLDEASEAERATEGADCFQRWPSGHEEPAWYELGVPAPPQFRGQGHK